MASKAFSKGRLALVAGVAGVIGVVAPACSGTSSGRVIPGFGTACTSDADCGRFPTAVTCGPGGTCIECLSSAVCTVPGEVCAGNGACAAVSCIAAPCPGDSTCDAASHRCVSSASGTGGAGGITGTGGINAGGITGTGGGGGIFGTGGITATGGAGGATGPGPDYLTVGGWHGYVWDSVNNTSSTITPPDFSTASVGGPYCASGIVAATTDYSAVAIVGWNINQAWGADQPLDVVYPSGTNLVVNFTNAGGSPLRVQIQGLNGATDENDRWCYDISTSTSGPVTIPFSYFNTTCWDGLGTYYAGQAISAVMLMVPGALTSISFNICLSGMSEN